MRPERWKAWSRAVQSRFRFFGRARARCVVGTNGVNGALEHTLPKRIMMILRAHRRHHLHEETIGIVTGNAEIGRSRFHRELQPLTSRIAYHLEPLTARQMHHVKMRPSDL